MAVELINNLIAKIDEYLGTSNNADNDTKNQAPTSTNDDVKHEPPKAPLSPKDIANGFIGKTYYNQASGNDSNGVYNDDITILCQRYRVLLPFSMMTMDFDENRLNIHIEKDTNKILKVNWG